MRPEQPAPSPSAPTAEIVPARAEIARLREAEVEFLRSQGEEFASRSRSPATQRAYAADWRQFEAWCARLGLVALPAQPETLRLYATDLALQVRPDGTRRFKVTSIRRALAAIGRAHFDAGHGRDLVRHEQVANLMAGVARVRQERSVGRRPLLLDDVVAVVSTFEFDTWPAGVAATRDWFAVLTGFATAMRRSEVASLTAGQVITQPLDGLHVRLGATKGDQEGRGATLAVPYGTRPLTCLPCAWLRWSTLLVAWDAGGRVAAMRVLYAEPSPTSPGARHVCRGKAADLPGHSPALRRVRTTGEPGDTAITGAGLSEMLKRRLAAAGYDPTPYGWHSLRSGFVTQARRNGADARSVRRQTRHGTDSLVDAYDREHHPLSGNAVRNLGL